MSRTMVGVELAKLGAQLPVRIALTVCVATPIAVAVLMRIATTHPADTLFGRWSGTTGYATSLLVLSWVGAWGVPLLSGLIAGDIFASEDRHGTWKTILTRSQTRTELFVGKAIAATLGVWLAYALLALSSIIGSLVIVGHAPLLGLSGQLIGSGRALGLVAASWALALLPTTAFVALGLLFSITSRNTMLGILGPLLVALVLQLLETSTSGTVARSVLLSTAYDGWHALFTVPVHTGTVIESAVLSLTATAVFGAAAWYLLRRREFAGADAVPASMHTSALRLSAPVVGLAVALAVLSRVGPSALVAPRLEASIATTFGNLAEVRYEWQTGSAAETDVPWTAACDRGGATQGNGGAGAGDDWACTLIDRRASDGLGATILDVDVKADGCYSVQSPPGAVGALKVVDDRGTSFINPLYAFDGCLGSP